MLARRKEDIILLMMLLKPSVLSRSRVTLLTFGRKSVPRINAGSFWRYNWMMHAGAIVLFGDGRKLIREENQGWGGSASRGSRTRTWDWGKPSKPKSRFWICKPREETNFHWSNIFSSSVSNLEQLPRLNPVSTWVINIEIQKAANHRILLIVTT